MMYLLSKYDLFHVNDIIEWVKADLFVRNNHGIFFISLANNDIVNIGGIALDF